MRLGRGIADSSWLSLRDRLHLAPQRHCCKGLRPLQPSRGGCVADTESHQTGPRSRDLATPGCPCLSVKWSSVISAKAAARTEASWARREGWSPGDHVDVGAGRLPD